MTEPLRPYSTYEIQLQAQYTSGIWYNNAVSPSDIMIDEMTEGLLHFLVLQVLLLFFIIVFYFLVAIIDLYFLIIQDFSVCNRILFILERS